MIIIWTIVLMFVLIYLIIKLNNNDDNINRTIYCFWFGKPMNNVRKQCLDSVKQLATRSKCRLILINDNNLHEYIKHDDLHESFKYLSETHKADYMRTYMMHFYGGGYTDIKHYDETANWNNSFTSLAKRKDIFCVGVKETKGGSPIPGIDESKLITNCAYIFKKNTPFTNDWYSKMMEKMKEKGEMLKKYPSIHPQCGIPVENRPGNKECKDYKYPLYWSELLGSIFHVINYQYSKNCLQTLPRWSNKRYH